MDNLTEQLMKYSCKDCDSSGCCAWKQRVVDGDKYCQRPKTFAEDMLRIFESNNYIQLRAEEAELIKTHTFISKLSLLLLSDKEKKALKSGIAKLQKIIDRGE